MGLIEGLVGVKWGSGHSSLSPTVLKSPSGFSNPLRGGLAPQPIRAGALVSPKGLIVGLSVWGLSLVSHISLGAWGSGLSSCDV